MPVTTWRPFADALCVTIAFLASILISEAALAQDNESEGTFSGTITIIQINDIHGQLTETDTHIGYPKIAAFVAEKLDENPNTLVLDAGDVIAGHRYATIDAGLSFAPILNTIGFDAMVAGNAEFISGTENLRAFERLIDYPMLVGNLVYRDSGDLVGPGHLILELENGMRVGLVGATSPVSAVMGSTDVVYVDAISSTRHFVNKLRSADVDVVVGLFHLGEIDPVMNSFMVADADTGLDIIIDGHSHTVFPEGIVRNGVLISQAGGYGTHVGVVDLTFDDGELVETSARLYDRAYFADRPEKPETRAALDEFLAVADEFFEEVIGETAVALDGRREVVRVSETTLGNLTTDAVRHHTGADIAIVPAGYMDGHFEPGELTRGDLFTMVRIDTEIVVMELTGSQLTDYLSHTSATFPEPAGAFAQISGGTYWIDADGDTPVVHSVTVGGEPISKDETYTVAVIVNHLERPGTSEGTVLSHHGMTSQILAGYLAENSPVTPEVEDRFGAAPTPRSSD